MIFAFVLLGIYKLENWPILSDYLVKLASQFLYFNHLSKNTNIDELQLQNATMWHRKIEFSDSPFLVLNLTEL